ncbi:hypothetical protein LP52_19960 [Streptomonospora alba]|uniref:MalT-like TPR region domain-containing protein n=1 Tax=Streptomonospora alba TaxID=183763 RepID=A0A0C2G1R0_9ACTN|nr:tetratricopeptide repeat protein [Streptomonospora alba]KIH97253.1 hypothetical protein LP52_19960 [Streptomonospora alba]
MTHRPDTSASAEPGEPSRHARALLDIAALLGTDGFPEELLTTSSGVLAYMDAAPGQPRLPRLTDRLRHRLRRRADAGAVRSALAELRALGQVADDGSGTVLVHESARQRVSAALTGEACARAVATVAEALHEYWLDAPTGAAPGLAADPSAPTADERADADRTMLACTAALAESAGDTLLERNTDLLFAAGHRMRESPQYSVEQEVEFWQRLQAGCERVSGADSEDAFGAREQLGGALLTRGRQWAETAARHYDALLADRSRARPPGDEELLATRANRGEALARAGRAEEAAADLEAALVEAADQGVQWPATAHLRSRLALAHRLAGDPDAALALRREEVETAQESYGRASGQALYARLDLARELRDADLPDEAAEAFRELRDDCGELRQPADPLRRRLFDEAQTALEELEHGAG